MRGVQSAAFRLLVTLCGVLVLFVTLGVFFYVFYRGRNVLSVEFVTGSPSGLPIGTEGGIFPAIVGSLYLGVLSGAVSGTLALWGAVFTVFYCRNSWVRRVLRGSVHCLSGFPSILFGLTGYTILVYGMGLSRSLLTASITIAAMIFPFIFIRVEKTLKEYYLPVMTASLALGISRSHAVLRMILPHAAGEIVATVLLGMTFGMGATAPVIFTGAVLYAGVPAGLGDPFMSLPYHLYMLVNDGISTEYAYGTACVLVLVLLAVNILCRLPGYIKERRGLR